MRISFEPESPLGHAGSTMSADGRMVKRSPVLHDHPPAWALEHMDTVLRESSTPVIRADARPTGSRHADAAPLGLILHALIADTPRLSVRAPLAEERSEP